MGRDTCIGSRRRDSESFSSGDPFIPGGRQNGGYIVRLGRGGGQGEIEIHAGAAAIMLVDFGRHHIGPAKKINRAYGGTGVQGGFIRSANTKWSAGEIVDGAGKHLGAVD